VLTTVAHVCADGNTIWEPHPPGTLRLQQACIGISLPLPFFLSSYSQCHCFSSQNVTTVFNSSMYLHRQALTFAV